MSGKQGHLGMVGYDSFSATSGNERKSMALTVFVLASIVTLALPSDAKNCLLPDTRQRAATAAAYGQEVADEMEKLRPVVQGGVQGETIVFPTEETRIAVFDRVLSIAKKSKTSRRMTIAFLRRMLDVESGDSDIRIYAAYLLSELKAVETLDVLVNHLDLRGSLSSLSLTIRPMVNFVVKFGEVAIPYLETGLNDERIVIREEASTALGLIGGERARGMLQNALNKESDKNVLVRIKGALTEIANEQNRKRTRLQH